jgi:hypothetical protein
MVGEAAHRLRFDDLAKSARAQTARSGLGQIELPRLQRSVELLARGLELPRVVQVDLPWSDKYLPAADLRRL